MTKLLYAIKKLAWRRFDKPVEIPLYLSELFCPLDQQCGDCDKKKTMSLDSSMAVIRVLTFVLPLTVSGLSNRTGRHFSSNEKRHSVTNIAEVDEFHFNKYPDFQLDDPIGAVRRVERVFGGFMKNTKTNIEGRIYVSYHNQHCQLRENQCELSSFRFNS